MTPQLSSVEVGNAFSWESNVKYLQPGEIPLLEDDRFLPESVHQIDWRMSRGEFENNRLATIFQSFRGLSPLNFLEQVDQCEFVKTKYVPLRDFGDLYSDHIRFVPKAGAFKT